MTLFDLKACAAPQTLHERKSRQSRVRLTHLELRRGDIVYLRIAIATEVLGVVGDELGALIKKAEKYLGTLEDCVAPQDHSTESS